MTKQGSAGGEGALGERRARFNRWRRGRPFAGGALLILASLVIAWIPIHIAPETILLGKALSPVGLLFAALVFLCGMFALTRPGLADIFGIFGIVFSIFSLYGALGGLGLGLLLGLMGGNLCYAWEVEDDEEQTGGSGGSDTTNGEGSDFDFDDDAEESDGLFGTRSVRSAAGRTTAESETTGAGGRTASVAMLVITVVVLGAFAQPFVVTAQSFPEQSRIGGTVVVAEQFSGQSYHHQNVTTDTSNRARVSAARQSFSSASIQGMTIYKNFRTGEQAPFHLTITGTASSAPNGLSLTASEFYASQLSLAGVVPIARNKWSTCPGQDFLLSNGDIGNPPITGQDVTTNTHRLYAPTVTIQNLTLTVQKGTKSTSVTGVPECTKNPVEPVLGLFNATALQQLVDAGRLDPNATTNGTVTDLTAPEEVRQGETFDVNATVTNTGYVNDAKTVAFRFDDETRRQNVTLAPNESATVTFADIGTNNTTPGTYNYSVSTGNDSATGTIRVTATGNTSENTTSANATTNGTATPTATNETTATAATDTGGNATPTSTEESTSTPSSTETNATADTETTTATPTDTPTPNASEASASTAGADGTETTATPTETTTTPAADDATTATTNGTSAESALVALP